MHKILLSGGLTVALLIPFGHAWSHLSSRDGAAVGAPSQAGPILAQSDQKHGMAGDGEVRSFTVGDLVVENPWARESVTRTGAAYLKVRNDGDQDDRLLGVASEVAGKVELHESVMQEAVMKMRPVEEVLVPAHGEAALAPGGLHVMLMGLDGPLKEGESFVLILEFERAGKVEVMAEIMDIGHAGTGGHSH